VTINVTAVNDPPVAVNDFYYTTPPNAIVVNALGGVQKNDYDIEGSSLNATVLVGPTKGTLSLFNVNGSFTYTPNANVTGTDTFTYKVNDGALDSATATVTIQFNGGIVSVPQDSFVELDLSGLEIDAGYNNELGMFIVQDASGTVLGPNWDVNGNVIASPPTKTYVPGDLWYARAAIEHSSRRIILPQNYTAETKNMAAASRQQHNYRVMVEAGSFVSFYAIQNQTTDFWLANNRKNEILAGTSFKRIAFFTAQAANPDAGVSHFQVTTLADGSTRYGHEDLLASSYNAAMWITGESNYGGAGNQSTDSDFNDMNFTIKVTPITNSPAVKFFVDQTDGNSATADTTYYYNAQGNSVNTASTMAAANTQSVGLSSNATGDKLWSIDANKNVYLYSYNAANTPSQTLDGAWTPQTATSVALTSPTDIATDGTSIWVVDNVGAASKIYYYQNAASNISGTAVSATSVFSLLAANTNPSGLAVDATRFFVTDLTSKEVFVYDRTTGASLGRWNLDPGNTQPTDITTEPTGATTFSSNLYVVDKYRGETFTYTGGALWTNNGNPDVGHLITRKSNWKYLQTTSYPTSWTTATFDDSAWLSGRSISSGMTAPLFISMELRYCAAICQARVR
jgi:hypothetical protein